MIRLIKPSSSPVAALFESFPEGGLRFFRKKPIAVYEASELRTHSCVELVDRLKQYAVIGVVERDTGFYEWGPNFCVLASCFYTTGFRPLLLNFLGSPSLNDLPTVFSVLRRSYMLGWADRPVIRLGGASNGHAEKDRAGFG